MPPASGRLTTDALTPPSGVMTLKSFGPVVKVCGTNSTIDFAPSIEFLGASSGTSLIFYPHSAVPLDQTTASLTFLALGG